MSKLSGNSSHRSPSKTARIFGIISRCQSGASSQQSSSAMARSSSVTRTISPVSGSKYDADSSLAASRAEMTSRREMTFDMVSNPLAKNINLARGYYRPALAEEEPILPRFVMFRAVDWQTGGCGEDLSIFGLPTTQPGNLTGQSTHRQQRQNWCGRLPTRSFLGIVLRRVI